MPPPPVALLPPRGPVLRLVAALLVCAATAGCMGSWAMRGTRLHYNKSLSHTASQEILLNIVRMRYGETPTFFDLPSVISQTEASVTGTGAQKAPLYGVVSGVFSLRDTPTLSYHPRTGDNLAASLLKPLKAEAILDVAPGNDTRTFLLAFVDSINGVTNSPTATSPSSRILQPNDDYRYGVELFTGLQNRGAVRMRVATIDEKPQGTPLPVDRLIAADMLTATQNDYVFQVVGDEATLLTRSRCLAMTIVPDELSAGDVEELRRAFRLMPGLAVYRVKSQEDDEIDLDAEAASAALLVLETIEPPPAATAADDEPRADVENAEVLPPPPAEVVEAAPEPSPIGPEPREIISVNVRSGYQVLAFLSKGVEVPEAHVRRGSVILFKGPDGRPFDGRRLTKGLFHVCVQKHKPLRSDLAVYYRGYWYYIPEDDVHSRATLNYVKLVLDMRSEVGDSPVLTLPVN